LIRDAAYDALPKATRADLHERFAIWVEERAPDLVELDEIAGYHLEQAARFRRELGLEADALAGRAADRLAGAGIRAARREDWSAAAALLVRALDLLAAGAPGRVPLLPALAEAHYWVGDFDAMEAVVAEATATGDPDVVAQASFLRNNAQGHRSPHGLARLQSETEALIERYDGRLADDSLAVGYLTLARLAYWRGALGASAAAGELAFEHATRAGRGDILRLAAGTVAAVLKWDATPWPDAERRAAELFRATDAEPLLDSLAHAAAAQRRFDEARGYLDESARRLRERGARLALATRSMVAGYVEFLAARFDLAEPILRSGWEELGALGEQGYRSTVGAMLGETLAALGRLDEAREVTDESERITAPDDFVSVAGVLRTRGAIALAAGDPAAAATFFDEAIQIVAPTEYMVYELELWVLYAQALAAAGDAGARAAAERALELAETKQFLVLADHARELLSS
jgi:tetratricopeptide (TPR) repeat protein